MTLRFQLNDERTLIFRPPTVTHLQLTTTRLFAHPALFITLLFITHPILTEAVNAISFREDLLAFFFYMATLNLYLFLKSYPTSLSSYLLYAISGLLYFIALLSKEMAATLPLIIYLYEWFYSLDRRRNLHFINWSIVGYIAISFFYIYLRFYLFYNPLEKTIPSWEISERLLTIPYLLLNYLKVVLFPISLSADYNIVPVKSIFSHMFILPFIVAIIFLVIIILIRKKEKGIAFGILFFGITLIPVYNLIPLNNPFAERYLYLPTSGLTIAVGLSLYNILTILYSKSKSGYSFALNLIFIILIIYSSQVFVRNGTWINNRTLWSDTAKKVPDSNRAHAILGFIHLREWRVDDAIREYQTAIKLEPNDATSQYELGIAYFRLSKFDEAIFHIKAALSIVPTKSIFHNNLANIYLKKRLYMTRL